MDRKATRYAAIWLIGANTDIVTGADPELALQLQAHLQAQQQVAYPPSTKPTPEDCFSHCKDAANARYLLSSGKNYQSIFQPS